MTVSTTTPMTEADARRITERIRMAARAYASAAHEEAAARRLLRDEPRQKALYLMQSGDCGPIKIGVAYDVAARRSQLQSGNPDPIYVRFALSAMGHRESEMHQRLSAFRISGEWFEPVPEVFDWFRQAAI